VISYQLHSFNSVFAAEPVPGSEAAGAAAKGAASHGILSSEQALGNDFHAYFHCAILSFWQDKWTTTQDNRLRAVKPSIEVWQSFSSNRKEEVLLASLQIGCTLA
jgi:hypothetical protein